MAHQRQAGHGELRIPPRLQARAAELGIKPASRPTLVAAAASEVLDIVSGAGLDAAFALELIARALPMDEVATRVATAIIARARQKAYVADVQLLCKSAGWPRLADGYVAGAMAIADVKAHLLILTAKSDMAVEIDTGLLPDRGGAAHGAALGDSYAKLNPPAPAGPR